MGNAWLTMNNLRKHIFRLRYPPFSLTPVVTEEIEENFMKRWDMILTDLHYTRAMLNPYLRGHMELQQNREAKRALNRVFCKLSNPLGVGFNEMMAEMSEYEERLRLYSPEEAPDIQVANLQPHQWWSRVSGCRVERSLLWKITGILAATNNDLRVGNQLLFSKSKIIIKQTVFNRAHTKDPRLTSSIQR